jgi:hypothetical protein
VRLSGQHSSSDRVTTAAEAMGAIEAGLAFLASADAASWPGETLASVLRALGRAESAHVAVHARVLAAFNAQGACEADGQGTTRAWLHWQTRVTRGAAGAATGWMRRLAVHPRVAASLAAGEISRSWARQVCDWSDQLPPDVRDDADQILLTAAAGGADLPDLSGLAREMYERTAPPDPDDGPPPDDAAFRDRSLRLDLHYQGAGRLEANLTPECSAAVMAWLDALGKKAGPEDDRTPGQRNHDALEEGARMLLATGALPDVAGQPAHLLVHATLDQIIGLLGGVPPGPPGPPADGPDISAAAADGTAVSGAGERGPGSGSGADGDVRAPVTAGAGAAGHSGSGSGSGSFAAGRAAGDGEAGWISTAAALGYACDARIATVVTGRLDPEVVAAAVSTYFRSAWPAAGTRPPDGRPPDGPPGGAAMSGGPPLDPLVTSGSSWEASAGRLQATLVRYATAMLSGPGGLAAALRGGLPGPVGSGVSLPLDITSATAAVPPHLRRAVIVRDRHCAFPGCTRVPARCQVHHVIPRSEGGPTSLTNLVLLCSFHHLYLIHRRGWKLALNADGTTTAMSPGGRKVLHSHAPPGAAA